MKVVTFALRVSYVVARERVVCNKCGERVVHPDKPRSIKVDSSAYISDPTFDLCAACYEGIIQAFRYPPAEERGFDDQLQPNEGTLFLDTDSGQMVNLWEAYDYVSTCDDTVCDLVAGDVQRHFKGGLYVVRGFMRDRTKEWDDPPDYVIYSGLTDDDATVYARTLSNWMSAPSPGVSRFVRFAPLEMPK